MAVKVLTVGPGTLSIGADLNLTNFESQVTSCRLVPSVDNDDPINVLSGEQVAGDRTESFALEGSFLQDFGSLGSTTEWLFQHRGETQPSRASRSSDPSRLRRSRSAATLAASRRRTSSSRSSVSRPSTRCPSHERRGD